MQVFVGGIVFLIVLVILSVFYTQYAEAKNNGVKPNFKRVLAGLVTVGVAWYGYTLMLKDLRPEFIAMFVLGAILTVVFWD